MSGRLISRARILGAILAAYLVAIAASYLLLDAASRNAALLP